MTSTKLTMIRGDSKSFNLHLKDGNDVDIDISGWTVYFTVKKNLKDEDSLAVVRKDITSHTSAMTGETTITLVPDDTNTLTADLYLYDIQTKSDTGTVITIAKGIFVLEADITRRD